MSFKTTWQKIIKLIKKHDTVIKDQLNSHSYQLKLYGSEWIKILNVDQSLKCSSAIVTINCYSLVSSIGEESKSLMNSSMFSVTYCPSGPASKNGDRFAVTPISVTPEVRMSYSNSSGSSNDTADETDEVLLAGKSDYSKFGLHSISLCQDKETSIVGLFSFPQVLYEADTMVVEIKIENNTGISYVDNLAIVEDSNGQLLSGMTIPRYNSSIAFKGTLEQIFNAFTEGDPDTYKIVNITDVHANEYNLIAFKPSKNDPEAIYFNVKFKYNGDIDSTHYPFYINWFNLNPDSNNKECLIDKSIVLNLGLWNSKNVANHSQSKVALYEVTQSKVALYEVICKEFNAKSGDDNISLELFGTIYFHMTFGKTITKVLKNNEPINTDEEIECNPNDIFTFFYDYDESNYDEVCLITLVPKTMAQITFPMYFSDLAGEVDSIQYANTTKNDLNLSEYLGSYNRVGNGRQLVDLDMAIDGLALQDKLNFFKIRDFFINHYPRDLNFSTEPMGNKAILGGVRFLFPFLPSSIEEPIIEPFKRLHVKGKVKIADAYREFDIEINEQLELALQNYMIQPSSPFAPGQNTFVPFCCDGNIYLAEFVLSFYFFRGTNTLTITIGSLRRIIFNEDLSISYVNEEIPNATDGPESDLTIIKFCWNVFDSAEKFLNM